MLTSSTKRSTGISETVTAEGLQTIFNQTSVGIVQTTLDGSFILVNDRYCEIVARNREELYQMRFQDITHPEDLANNLTVLQESISYGRPFSLEKRYIRPNGSEVWININISIVKDVNENPLYILGVCLDINEQKQAEKDLAYQYKTTQIIANNATVALFMMDGQGCTTFANQAAEKMTGFTLNEMRGKVLHDQIHNIHPDGSDFPMDECSIGQTIFSKGVLTNHEDVFVRKDGSLFPVLCSATAVEEDNIISAIILEVQDITERKQAEASLEQKNAQLQRINNDLDNFIYTASHDLKAPIHNIEGLLNVLAKSLQEGNADKEQTDIVIKMLYKSVDRFKNTIIDLTEVAKVESNTNDDFTEISFHELFDEVKSNISRDIEESNVLITCDFTDLPSLHFSKKNLRSILYNLVSNAVKYRSPYRTPAIHITTASTGSEYKLLSVKDNGLGIKEDDKPKVFMMFKRLHQHVEGTGIGLSIVKKIIDNNGGKIEIISEPGKGTEFKVYFKV
jgi:PAS domain S-box-containing protein